MSLKEIAEIPHQGKVGVFVNESIDKIVEIASEAKLDLIQLHGDETEEFISELRQKLNEKVGIIKVIRVGSQMSEVRCQLKKISNLKSQISNLLFDTDSKSFGGTGQTFDWNILNEIEIPLPYFLSGGISNENFHQLSTINQKPFAVDINSKFEIEPGNKDIEKIITFKNLISKI